MTELDKIESDVEMEMTKNFYRAFQAEGCEPACHCCQLEIKPGMKFKLAQNDDNDEMLCADCTVQMLLKNKQEQRKQYYTPSFRATGGGFTRRHREG